MTHACDACQKAHKKCVFFVHTFQPCGKRRSGSRFPSEDSFVVDNYESIPKREWTPQPQAGRWESFWTISPVLSSIDLSTAPPEPPSDCHFTP
ncbi:hypothetical protein O181_022436 [Austropuccinia psidii MF-1]|uniref:Zn(2)-C6 fungal-type domain-containing protein n=1 Tax=Austropuccinia psidii MF-1 TaxID=1389203 RepID=A0A9Q3CHF8_9BASI|nr:hypothetical protein [Austropuccinia psidii MF-1]